MAKIKNISLVRLRNGAHSRFMDKVYKMCVANTYIAENCKAQLETLCKAKDAEIAAGAFVDERIITREISNTIALCKKYINILYYFAEYATLSADTAMVSAGNNVQTAIKNHRNSMRGQQENESGKIASLVVLMKGKLASDVTAVGADNVVADLAVASAKACDTLDKRDSLRAKRGFGTISTLRKQSDEAYMALRDVFIAHAILDGEANYADTLNEWNGIVRKLKFNISDDSDDANEQNQNGSDKQNHASDTGDKNGKDEHTELEPDNKPDGKHDDKPTELTPEPTPHNDNKEGETTTGGDNAGDQGLKPAQ
jgi:hypothetical protein